MVEGDDGGMNRAKELLEAAAQFNRQRRTAKQRGVEWKLDFWEWLKIWEDSGHFEERGRRRGQYQMCRNSDVGPYASSTVRIDTQAANIREAVRIRLERQATACSSY